MLDIATDWSYTLLQVEGGSGTEMRVPEVGGTTGTVAKGRQTAMANQEQKFQGARKRASSLYAAKVRYFVDSKEQSKPLTAKEVRDWRGRVTVGDYTIRPVDGYRSGSGRDAWNLFLKMIVGTRGPVETDGFVDEFATFRDALAAARRGARKTAALRASSRGPAPDALKAQEKQP